MKQYLKLTLFGFLTWVIPFVVSFFFYDKTGHLLIVDIFLFKSIMIITGCLTGVVLLALYFKNINEKYLYHGILIGIVWLAMNWILDFLILVPMAKLSLYDYFAQIGLRYLIIPIISIGTGYMLARKAR
jgi:uncharacterized membrane protein YpjA